MLRPPLRLESLESREVLAYLNPASPVNLIPGNFGPGAVPEMQTTLQATPDPTPDYAAVALDGGSCRLVVIDGDTGAVLLDTIALDPAFRGGGYIHTIQPTLSLHAGGDALLVGAGPGGGPQVVEFRFDSTSGKMVETLSFFAPYDIAFRGGLQVSSGDTDGDGLSEILFLPAEGGAPNLRSVDQYTHETELSIFVGVPTDYSGDARFESTGGTITWHTGQVFWIQYGPVEDNYAPSKLWTFGGVDVTNL